MTKHGVDIIRFLKWRKKAKEKSIDIRLYEIIYVGLLMLWSKRGKPPLQQAIYEYVSREEYEKELSSGMLFDKFLFEIRETPCSDKTGYYLENSAEILTFEDYKQILKTKKNLIKKLSKNKIVERYAVILEICKKYHSWVLDRKREDLQDITKVYNFETTERPPMEI